MNPPERKTIRLRGFNYRALTAYFVTICTHNRLEVFGTIRDGQLRPTRRGMIAAECWEDLPNHHPHIELGAFVIMPNHVHGLVYFVGATPASSASSTLASHSLGSVVGSYKSAVSRKINVLRPGAAANLWQRGYYDHVIRHEKAHQSIWQYIEDNPRRWDEDDANSSALNRHDMSKWLASLTTPAGDAGVAPTGNA